MPRTFISLEEHFYSEAVFAALDERGAAFWTKNYGLLTLLQDMKEQRLNSMNSGAISIQVVSHCFQSGDSDVRVCQSGNNELAAKMKTTPGRFAGFATLPLGDPNKIADELKRCVTELGFVGALIDSHVPGRNLNDPDFDPLWSMAQELDVPIYIHPAFPSEETVLSQYLGSYCNSTALSLGMGAWGWHSATGLCVVQLFAASVFDR